MDFDNINETKRKRYEQELGPADDFIPTNSKRDTLLKWALLLGLPPVDIYAMSNVQLANLYHEHAGGNRRKSDTSQQPMGSREKAELIQRVVDAIADGVTSMDALRGIIRQEIPTAETLRALAQEVYDALPPRQLEIVTERSSVVLDGLRHYKTETVVRVAALGHPIMMVGPAGSGKTEIGRSVAKALGLEFFITSTVFDTHELLGFVDGYGNYKATPFRKAFEFGGVWVADEIDAWDASALLAANSALANGIITFPDRPDPITRHNNFRMIATANTFGHGADKMYVGRNELDAASLDRFAVIPIDYDTTLEELLSNGNPQWLHRVWSVRKQVMEKKIRHVVSMRALTMGAAALQQGFTRKEVEDMYLFKGMSKTDREKIS